MDGHNNYATMHVVTEENVPVIKERIREELKEHGIGHVTLELESKAEACHEEYCHVEYEESANHHHHHHNH